MAEVRFETIRTALLDGDVASVVNQVTQDLDTDESHFKERVNFLERAFRESRPDPNVERSIRDRINVVVNHNVERKVQEIVKKSKELNESPETYFSRNQADHAAFLNKFENPEAVRTQLIYHITLLEQFKKELYGKFGDPDLVDQIDQYAAEIGTDAVRDAWHERVDEFAGDVRETLHNDIRDVETYFLHNELKGKIDDPDSMIDAIESYADRLDGEELRKAWDSFVGNLSGDIQAMFKDQIAAVNKYFADRK